MAGPGDWVLKEACSLSLEVQALGLTVLVDARICPPSSSLFWGLSQLQVSPGLWRPTPSCSICVGLGAGMSSAFLQEAVPGSVHQVLLVGEMPEEVPSGLQVLSHVGQRSVEVGCFPTRPGSQHRFFPLQLEQLSSLQSLLTHISASWLPASLGGGLPYCHQAWLHFRMVSALGGA